MVHQDSLQKTWQYDTRCCRLVKKVGLDRTIHRSDLQLGLILNPNMPILLPASFGWNPEMCQALCATSIPTIIWLSIILDR